jgi:Ca2+-binding RTX toxin-like protein
LKSALVAAATVAVSLCAPAMASATSTLSVENGAIRYVGDDGPNDLFVQDVENGEQAFSVADDTVLGSGCHKRPPSTDGGGGRPPAGNVLCALAGVDRIEVSTGDGKDLFSAGNIGETNLPIHADMGPGDDQFEFGGTAADDIHMGDGNDLVLDGVGNDYIDAGPGDDTVAGNFDDGNDTIDGGDGNDNLSGWEGNDIVRGGPGNDLLQPSDGNDVLDGGPGNDEVAAAGAGASCLPDAGNDVMRGGPGDDKLCGGPGIDLLDGGDGNDALNAVDGTTDGPLTCGSGSDAVWSDPSDPVALDCEQRDDGRAVTLPGPDVLPVALPCGIGVCNGTLAVFATPKAPRASAAAPPPLAPPKAAGKALVRAKFKLGAAHGKRTLRLKLARAAAKRLRKLGATTVEARTVFTQGGKRYVVRRTFRVKPR